MSMTMMSMTMITIIIIDVEREDFLVTCLIFKHYQKYDKSMNEAEAFLDISLLQA
jgi:hypothetical protein